MCVFIRSVELHRLHVNCPEVQRFRVRILVCTGSNVRMPRAPSHILPLLRRLQIEEKRRWWRRGIPRRRFHCSGQLPGRCCRAVRWWPEFPRAGGPRAASGGRPRPGEWRLPDGRSPVQLHSPGPQRFWTKRLNSVWNDCVVLKYQLWQCVELCFVRSYFIKQQRLVIQLSSFTLLPNEKFGCHPFIKLFVRIHLFVCSITCWNNDYRYVISTLYIQQKLKYCYKII